MLETLINKSIWNYKKQKISCSKAGEGVKAFKEGNIKLCYEHLREMKNISEDVVKVIDKIII